MTEPILDRDGDWELRMTIYRNGRRVAVCDFLADSYDGMAHMAATLLQTREVTYVGRYKDEADKDRRRREERARPRQERETTDE